MKLGEYLRSAREKQNLSYADVSKIIKIKESFLVALEEENFSEMPPEPFITGFIKSYANFLDLNTQEAIDLYKNSSDIDEVVVTELPADITQIKATTVSKKGLNLLVFKSIVFVLLLILIIFGAYNFLSKYKTESVKQQIVEEISVIAETENIIKPEPNFSDMSLRIEATGNCWVKLYIDDKAAFEAIFRKGDKRIFNANEKFKIVLGNISGIKVFLDDNELDVTKGSHKKVNSIDLTKANYKDYFKNVERNDAEN